MANSRENSKKKVEVETEQMPNVSKVHKWLMKKPTAIETGHKQIVEVFGEEEESRQDYPRNPTPILRKKKAADDMSTTYRRNGILYYKSHPKARPEILAVNGYAIWYYHEVVSDIEVEGKRHRAFYNPYAKEFFVNEIIEENGRIFLKNPKCDGETVRQVMEVIEQRILEIPGGQWKNTFNYLKKKMDDLYKSPPAKPKLKLNQKRQGRPEEPYLREATYWAIVNRKLKDRNKKISIEDIRCAYEVYRGQATSFIAFRNNLHRIGNTETWNEWVKERRNLIGDKKRNFTLTKFAKNYLKISHSLDKYRVRSISK